MKANEKIVFRKKLVCVAIASCFTVTPVYANPLDPTVVSGQVGFSAQGNTLTITNSPNAIINWQQFSIGAGETTNFIQQNAQSAVLNRVVGQDPSSILGSLISNGRVYLINPNGIMFGQGAVIDVAGMLASTLRLSNADFLAGRLNLTDGVGAGGIDNQGKITTPAGGNVYLVAPDISNSGVITSPQGEILLAAGHSVNLVDTANPDVQVAVNAPDTQVVNIGTLMAQSGKVGIYGALIDQQGVINANTAVAGKDGTITLRASKDITLEPGSVTTASGTTGGVKNGGEIRIVADGTLNVRKDSQIHVDGGASGGSGGFLELSGKGAMALNGSYTGRALAAGYKSGSLLLDPQNIVICEDYLACGGATSASHTPISISGGTTTASSGTAGSTLYITPHMNGTGASPTPWSNVTLLAGHDITVASPISNSDVAGSLTLTAGHDITINHQEIGGSSRLITVGDSNTLFAHDLTMNAGHSISIEGDIYLGSNTLTLNGATLGTGTVQIGGSHGVTVDTLGAMHVSGSNLWVFGGADGVATNVNVGGNLYIGASSDTRMNEVLIGRGTGGHALPGLLAGKDTNVSVSADAGISVYAASLAVQAGKATASSDGNPQPRNANAELLSSNGNIDINLNGTGLKVLGGSADATALHPGSLVRSANATIAAGNADHPGKNLTVTLSNGATAQIRGGSATAHASDGGGRVATATADAGMSATGTLSISGGGVTVAGGSALARARNITPGASPSYFSFTGSGNNTATANANTSLSAGTDLVISGGALTVAGGRSQASAYNSGLARAAFSFTGTNSATAHADVSLIATTGKLDVSGGTINIYGGSVTAKAFNAARSNSTDVAYSVTGDNKANDTTAKVSLTAGTNVTLNAGNHDITLSGGHAQASAYDKASGSNGSGPSGFAVNMAGNNTAVADNSIDIKATGGNMTLIVGNGNINVYGSINHFNVDSSGGASALAYKKISASSATTRLNKLDGTMDATASNNISLTASGSQTLSVTGNGSINVKGADDRVLAGNLIEARGSFYSMGHASSNYMVGDNSAHATGNLTLSAGTTQSLTVAGNGGITLAGGIANAGSFSNSGLLQYGAGSGIAAHSYGTVHDNHIGTAVTAANNTADATAGLSLTGNGVTISTTNGNISISGGNATAYGEQAIYARGSSAINYHNDTYGDNSATAHNSLEIKSTGAGNLNITAGGGSLGIYGGNDYASAGQYVNGRGTTISSVAVSGNTLSGNMTADATNGLTLSGNNITLSANNDITISGGHAGASAYQNAYNSSNTLTGGSPVSHTATANNGLHINAVGDVNISAGTGGSGSLTIQGGYAKAFANQRASSGNSNTLYGYMSGTATNTLDVSGTNITLTAANGIGIYGGYAKSSAYQVTGSSGAGTKNKLTGNQSASASNGLSIAATGTLEVTAGTGVAGGSLIISGSYVYSLADQDAYAGDSNTLSGNLTATATDGMTLSGSGVNLSAANGIVIYAASNYGNSSVYARADQDVYGNKNNLSGNHTATATNTLDIKATDGDMTLTVANGDISIYGGTASGLARKKINASSNSANSNTANGSLHATATSNFNMTATGSQTLNISGNGNIKVQGADARVLAGNLIEAQGASVDSSGHASHNTLKGDNTAGATSNMTLSAGGAQSLTVTGDGNITLASGKANAGSWSNSSLMIQYGAGNGIVAQNQYGKVGGNSIGSGYGVNNTASATVGLSLTGAGVTISTSNGDINIYGGDATAYAVQQVYEPNQTGINHIYGNNNSASATSSLEIKSTGSGNTLSITAGSGASGSGNLTIRGGTSHAIAGQTANGKGVTTTSSSTVGTYPSSYIYRTDTGTGNTLNGNNTANVVKNNISLTADGGITLAGTTVTVRQENSNYSGHSASAYRTIVGSNNTLHGNNTADINGQIDIGAGGVLSITATNGIGIYGDNAEGRASDKISGGRNNKILGSSDVALDNKANALVGITLSGSGVSLMGSNVTMSAGTAWMHVTQRYNNINSSGTAHHQYLPPNQMSWVNDKTKVTNNVTLNAGSGEVKITSNGGDITLRGGNIHASGDWSNYSSSAPGNSAQADLDISGKIVNLATGIEGSINMYGGTIAIGGNGYWSSNSFTADAKIHATSDMTVTAGSNVSLTGGSANGGYNTASAKAEMSADGKVTIKAGDITLRGGHANGSGNADAGISGSSIAIGSSSSLAHSLTVHGGTASGSGNANATLQANSGDVNINLSGNLDVIGGSVNGGNADALISASSGRIAIVAGPVTVQGGDAHGSGSADAGMYGGTITIGSSANPAGSLRIFGGNAYGGGNANASLRAIANSGSVNVNLGSGDLTVRGGYATNGGKANALIQADGPEGYIAIAAGSMGLYGGSAFGSNANANATLLSRWSGISIILAGGDLKMTAGNASDGGWANTLMQDSYSGSISIAAHSMTMQGGSAFGSNANANAWLNTDGNVGITLGDKLNVIGGSAGQGGLANAIIAPSSSSPTGDVTINAGGDITVQAGTVNPDGAQYNNTSAHADAVISGNRTVTLAAGDGIAVNGGDIADSGYNNRYTADAKVMAGETLIVNATGAVSLHGGNVAFKGSSEGGTGALYGVDHANAEMTALTYSYGGNIVMSAGSLAVRGGTVSDMYASSAHNSGKANAFIEAGSNVYLGYTVDSSSHVQPQAMGSVTVTGGTATGHGDYSSYFATADISAMNSSIGKVIIKTLGSVDLSAGTASATGTAATATATARINASPYTIYIDYPNLNVSYTVNGVPLVITNGQTGFFTGGTPAILDHTLIITPSSYFPEEPLDAIVHHTLGESNTQPGTGIIETIHFGYTRENKDDKPVCS